LEPRLQPSAFLFSTGVPDGKVATITEPANAHNSLVEFESADDFVLTRQTVIQRASFTGLLTGGATPTDVSNVVVEIYRVFPNDSDVGRTSGPPTFSTSAVPTRVNSPADVALDARDSAGQELTFHAGVLSTSFTALNSVSSASKISVSSGGNGPVTGEEVQFDVTFTAPFNLPAGHYFFVPQVGLSAQAPAGGHFLWLSAPRPIVPPATPFPAGVTDLQSWMRDDPPLAPDWLRIGTDIVGGSPAPTFNAAFSLAGNIDPNFAFVQALYNDFLGRNGSQGELATWVNVLPSLGQAGVATGVIRSPEGLTHEVDGLYVRLLGRSAVGGEEQGWVSLLGGGATEEQVSAGILSSPEFAAHANALVGGGNPDANFVQALYQLLLARTPGPAEANDWLSVLPTLGRAGVAAGFLASPEYRADVIAPLYSALLDRATAPSMAEVSGWVSSGLDFLRIELGFASSPEYFANG
jgi:hypothetical protein